jgi:hypothetical protein
MKNNGKIIKTILKNLEYYKRIFKTIFVFFKAFSDFLLFKMI